MSLSYQAWASRIERSYRFVLAAFLILALLCSLSLAWIRLDIDVLRMLPQGEPAFDDFKVFVAEFGQLDELYGVIEGAPMLRLQGFADKLATNLSELESVEAVQARLELEDIERGILGKYLYHYLSANDYALLARRLMPEGIERQVARSRAALSAPFDLSAARAVRADPLGLRRLAADSLSQVYARMAPRVHRGYFTSSDGEALLIFVRPTESAFDIEYCRRLMREVRGAVNEARRTVAAEGIRVAWTGSYVYALEDAATLKTDVRRYAILALIGVLAVFAVAYRSLRVLPFVGVPLAVATLVTFAFSKLLFEQLNAVSLSFAAILYGLSIDTGIHFYTRLLEERRARESKSPSAAVAATLRGLGRANVTGTTTTAVAFLVIGISSLTAVRQLGLLTATGMIVTCGLFFTLYPALALPLFRRTEGAIPIDTPRLERWASFAARRARWIVALVPLVVLPMLPFAFQVELDVNLTHLRPGDSQAARVQDEIASRFSQSATGGAILIERSELETALVDSERLTRRLRAYLEGGWVDDVEAIDGVLPSAQTQQRRLALYNSLPREQAIGSLREALERNGFVPAVFESFFEDFARPRSEIIHLGNPALEPLQFLLDHHVRAKPGGYMIATYVRPSASHTWHELADRLHADVADLRPRIAARALLEDELHRVLRRELLLFSALALLGNVLLLTISFRSLQLTTVILAPAILALLCVFGLMGWLELALDPVNLIVVPLVFGIGVDDGVYVVACMRDPGSVPEAIRRTGRALVVTSLTTITGFGILGLSRYPALASMGSLAALGLALCLMFTIVLLPALLRLIGGGGVSNHPPGI